MPVRPTGTSIAVALALGISVLAAPPSSASAGTLSTAPPAAAPPGCRYASNVALRASALCAPFLEGAVPPPGTGGALAGVSADSRSDAWAVGNFSSATQPFAPLIAHWNGAKWAKVASPNPDVDHQTKLCGVSAVSPADAWAVGFYSSNGNNVLPLILRWDGARWRQVPAPDPRGGAELYAVNAVSASDAWAAGIYGTRAARPFIVHWNGTRWTQVPAPAAGSAAIVNAVSARSGTDAWAAGYYAGTAGVLRAFTLHWNGTRWRRIRSVNPPAATGDAGLWGVATISADDAWAAGFAATGRESGSSLLLRWDGTRWAGVRVPGPPPPPRGEHLATVLTGVSASSPADVMVSGWYVLTDKAFDTAYAAFTLRWNGHCWTRLPSPLPNDDVQMSGASVVSANDAWTVGEATTTLRNGSSVTGTLSLHWNGSHWTDPATPY